MTSVLRITLITVTAFIAGCSGKISTNMTIRNPRCEFMTEALIARNDPRFSWELSSDSAGQKQTAWQIIVSDYSKTLDAGKGNIWDSGKRQGRETFNVRLEGQNLKSFTKYYWKVRTWDKDGNPTQWSNTASFITGAFTPSDWKAGWIGDKPEKPLGYPLVYKHIGYLSSYAQDQNTEKWIQIDLGKSASFDRIRLYPSLDNIKNIKDFYFPLAFRIEISDDGNNWKKIAEEHNAKLPLGDPVEIKSGNNTGRFVRITATKLQKYPHRVFDYEDQGDPSRLYAFSLSEMEILAGENVISKACSVQYRDALIKVDREDGYDPDMLTDGITGTPLHPVPREIPPCPLIRKSIELHEKPVQALVFASALGDYEIYVNGKKPDGRLLSPEWTDYNKRVQYQVYDITALLSKGSNVIGAQLADGWYAGMLGPTRWSEYFPKRGAYGLNRRLFFQMMVRYDGGRTDTIVSDGSWKIFRDGPMRIADNFLGEKYDAGREVPGWNLNGFDDSGWEAVSTVSPENINLVPQLNQPVKIIETLESKSVTKTKNGSWLFDAGANIAGWCRISIKGKPGDVIVLRHGELLDNSGELYTENLGAAVQRDTVILGQSGELEYEPRFTYHGFRYVEVSGLSGNPDKSILRTEVIASDQPRTGEFECSNPMLNQLYTNLNRSHVSNMIGVPTDCPQRDERCGWMGDIYIFGQTAVFNRDMAAFFTKWMTDIFDAQSARGTFPDIAPHPFAYEKHFTNAPGWADAALKVPWLMYSNYGDLEIIDRNFESYERYIENIRKQNPDLIWKSGLGLNYGDWLNGNTLNAEGFPKTGAQIPSTVFSTIMFYNSTRTLARMAEVTGRTDKAGLYNNLADKIKTAWKEHFVDKNGQIEGDAQSCYAMALFYDIFPPEMEQVFEKRMIEKFIPYSGRMNTGFHSTLCLMKELVKRGYEDKAYELLETNEFPSWGYSIEQGATSIWERWDGFVKGRGFQGAGMNSFNHYAFGAIGEWMYENILGIQPDTVSVGFTHFILKPLPGGTLTWAKGSYNSISGLIEAGWKKEGSRFEYNFSIPPNTSATVYIPSKSESNFKVNGIKNGHPELKIKPSFSNGRVVCEFPAGKWTVLSDL
jgi:alpha-L-rhamnosidase